MCFAPEHWNEAPADNLSAPFHAIRLVLLGTERDRWGSTINMASIHGLFATINRAAWDTTKSALIGLARAVARELGGIGITCNAICPAIALTPASVWWLRQDTRRDSTRFKAAETGYCRSASRCAASSTMTRVAV